MTALLPPTIAASSPVRPRTLNVMGVPTEVLLTAEQTNGACSFFRVTVPAGFVNPPHVHWFEDETFYVLEGKLEVTVAGQPVVVGPGQAAFGPKRVPHAFANRTDQPAVVLVSASPGGLERFFQACHEAFPPGAEIDPNRVAAIIERHAISLA